MKRLALIAAFIATATAPAIAGDVYIVGSVGQSTIDSDKSATDNALTSEGADNLASSLDKTDTAYKIQVGYQFNQYFAVEGGYVNLGKTDYSASFTGGGANANAKVSGLNIAALGILPISDSFSLFGKAGLIDAKVETTVSANGLGGSANDSSTARKWKANWGAGATYSINKQLGIRVEYEQFSKLGDANTTGEADVNLFSAGVAYKF